MRLRQILWTVLSLLWGVDITGCQQSSSIFNDATIETALLMATKDLDHIRLFLRAVHYHEDAESKYMHWFMHQTHFLHTIKSYSEQNLNGTKVRKQKGRIFIQKNFAIVVDVATFTLATRRYVHRDGTFFFVLTDYQSDDHRALVREVCYQLWKTDNIYRIYVLLPNEEILIYDPFVFNDGLQRYGELIQYTGKLSIEQTLVTDMRGYPLRIQIFRSVYARPVLNKKTGHIESVEGVDGKVAYLLQERMNFSMQLQDPDPYYYGERNKNGTYTNGAIGSIIRNEIDLCLTGFFLKDYMAPEMDFTVAVYDDQLCIYVPKAKRIPQSILPLFSVSKDLWLGFILAAFASATVWIFLRFLNIRLGLQHYKKLHLRQKFRFQIIRIYIDTWVVWVRVNILRFPPFYSERIFIASLCLVSVIFGAIFESSLATVYIHPFYYKDINTLKELDESGLKVIYKYTSMADDLFFNETSPLFANLNKKLTHVKNLNADIFLDTAKNGSKAGVSRYGTLKLEALYFFASKQLWIVPECPKYYTIAYVMPWNAPWKETVNDLLLRFRNAGLIQKWAADMQSQADIEISRISEYDTNDVLKVLTITDLQLSFYVVLLGNLLASLCFFIELFLKCQRRWWRRRHNSLQSQ